MRLIIIVPVVLAIAVYMLWFAIRSSAKSEEQPHIHARVVGKVPVAETAAVFERIDQMTMSAASAAGHPLDLLVEVRGQTMSCRCTPDFYAQAHVGDELIVAMRGTHCFVPNNP